MDKARYLVEAHLREGRSVAELAATHNVHPSWIYRLLARYREEDEAGLVPRSRRPKTSPTAFGPEVENEIVLLRKQLAEEGLDAGAETIHTQFERHYGAAPSVSTITRVLRRRGFITPQPQKRPRSSFIRFEADLPNECWQSDMTHWTLANATGVEIVNIVDDHSRLCLASVVLPVTKAVDVERIFRDTMAEFGVPASVLTDNGAIFTAKYRGGKVALENELERLGVVFKHSSPNHPQTCGKVERFHQTLKKYLAKQKAAKTLAALQNQIERFVLYYNAERPHRSLGRRTPQEVYEAKVKAHPGLEVSTGHYRVRHDKVDDAGSLTVRYQSKLFHIGMGRRFKGQSVSLLIADDDIRVLDTEGVLLRSLTLDPTRNYQPQSLGWVSTMS
jgi:transposase InsO family protein